MTFPRPPSTPATEIHQPAGTPDRPIWSIENRSRVDDAALMKLATDHLRLIDRRHRLLGDERRLFADPAWCILLDLFVAGATSARMPVLSCAIASRGPVSTAMRFIAILEEQSLIRREAHPEDGRSKLISLTPQGDDLVRQLLSSGG